MTNKGLRNVKKREYVVIVMMIAGIKKGYYTEEGKQFYLAIIP
jgi:hypothetical protein